MAIVFVIDMFVLPLAVPFYVVSLSAIPGLVVIGVAVPTLFRAERGLKELAKKELPAARLLE